ncbi:hypothetical protein E5Q_00701 [Mixia osmundae IAM 14324]|uniref:ABC transporter domain-containing protein n=1 Tax=Mixia osmundae (strain CBS 9802 / IAM 14324 / JCM 22182 / KY 12970) TaxID=764103 RepID=G7DTZ4_MIXOS|nr:hypothetical protein E5Q_00701 [Mixia osmundae IAM 14324]
MASRILYKTLPGLDPLVVEYIASFVDDDTNDADSEELDDLVRPTLESEGVSEADMVTVCTELRRLLSGKTTNGYHVNGGPRELEHVVAMDAQPAMSKSGLMLGSVDIESAGKSRESQVDIRKLEKAEAKIKAKMDKRSKKNLPELYESSKLVDAARQRKEYEDRYMAVNPLQTGAAKGKSKDIQLDNIDVNFGSNRILSGATLTLAHGRRYGLVGRNGIGKSTLLRTLAFREVAVPTHLSILYVEQEVLGDDTNALESVLQADVWRTRLLQEQEELNAKLSGLESLPNGNNGTADISEAEGSTTNTRKKDDAAVRLGEVHQLLIDIEAETGPSRAAELLAGLGFSTDDQSRATRTFSGGWRMRLSLARALFCKPDLLMLDEPSNNLDLNALAWLEDYLQTWPNTLLVVSHDRAFLDRVATDIVHQHSQRLDYYKGNFTQFYATKSERKKNQQREYDSQKQYREHLQAFIDRWRYNANRAAQAQSKIKILEKLPDLEPPEDDDVVHFTFAEADKLSPPLLQLNEVKFSYTPERVIVAGVNIDVGLDSRIGIIGPNGAGKSTLLKMLIGQLEPSQGQLNRNGRLRIGYFAQHHIDALDVAVSPVAFLMRQHPGRTEQEYRAFLGHFGITGMTSLQVIGTLSGGQKSRVAFALLSLARPHILLLDEPTNHLDIEGKLTKWNGGVITISHDERFINACCKQLYICADGKVEIFKGDVSAYKSLIVKNAKLKPT